MLAPSVAMISCLLMPTNRLRQVLHALAFGVTDTETIHGVNVALLSDFLKPPHRLRSVYPRETRRMTDVEVRTPAGQLIETRRLPVAVPISVGESVPNRKSLAKVNELGTLYALCAGMLNLIVILDALFPTTGGRRGANAHAANAKAGSQTGKGAAA